MTEVPPHLQPPKQIQKVQEKKAEYIFSFPIIYALPEQAPYILKRIDKRLGINELTKNKE
ncbi:hypothetical protein TVAG_103290 [Trichomonas vaginalis G3]|uniref:Uncharacterized protein n=1 Tax=Trichomonas vaginalis (strain ATCC PRA-98 / G3) TaxID=412133 RepID=A2EKP0_TRIV3|nr:hypothetical protein TVAGG3_0931350 [Trichomonas vaginalis G3]EAY06779.1 hypothetical protein TVAG_103290 [Trichomonas vaginalis G3]KAI5485860.1 hypothetical protein TVAGG3_0931350 [Trichomonas vaginalis G3]|eukprot:XP_001319002.1 hypothetical protein [Trichomonas vaginalis G3]